VQSSGLEVFKQGINFFAFRNKQQRADQVR
jgi:hypothetical protein